MRIRDYYRTLDVQTRMIEYLGGRNLDEATCYYIGRCIDTIRPDFNMTGPRELDVFLEREWDVARSLWDRRWLIVDLDVEYTNFDFPAEPFLDYERTFSLQEPVLRAIHQMLGNAGIYPRHTLSGRGHHFAWKVGLTDAAIEPLIDIGRLSPSLASRYTTGQPPDNEPVTLRLGKAFSGLGLVMEYVAYSVLAQAQPDCPIPVFPEAVDLGAQERGREIISVDISEYGDPLHTRGVRVPFSIYLKPWLHADVLTPQIAHRVPIMVMVPSDGADTREVAQIMRDLGKAAEWASQTSCLIPDCSRGMEVLATQYMRSEISRFHDWFYSVEPEPPDRWPVTYDRVSMSQLPGHVRYIIEHPNDLLLKPSAIRQVAAFLLEDGWHPRHIAGLIQSKYERDYGWLNQWYVYDAGMRADFHARVLSGLIRMGYDRSARLPAAAQL
jgi:hypothetical protein